MNSKMRRLQIHLSGSPTGGGLPGELEELLAAGWREIPDGALLLGANDESVSKRQRVPAGEIGTYEYRNNDFAVPDEDLVREVRRFAPRLASAGALVYDDQVNYRKPGGHLPKDVLRFLGGMASRGLAFAEQALVLASQQQLDAADALISVVSTGTIGDVLMHGTTVKFTTARGMPSGWFDMHWFDDLERFELEAMAVLTMDDALGSR